MPVPPVPQSEWLVYVNTTYYPWAEIITAGSAEEAANLVQQPGDHEGAVIAVPFDPSTAFVRESWDGELEQLREEGRERLDLGPRP